MPKSTIRAYSLHSKQAVKLLGKLIRTARIEQKISGTEAAERAAISRSLLQRIEKGDMKCEIGAAFELATTLGIPLFDSDDESLTKQIRHADEKLSLLPKAAHKPRKDVDDDF